MTSRLLRVGLAVVLVLAVLGGGAAGVAVADHDSENDNCSGLHEADERTDGTEGEDETEHNHDECHGNADGG